MKKTFLGKTGYPVSPLGFGGAPVGYLKTERDRVSKILNFMLDSGVNLIDTAASYEGSEEMIAATVGHRRGEFVLVSKCGGKLPDIDAPAWSAEMVMQSVERSLRRLKTDQVDVMLLHSCDLATLKKGEALGALVKAVEAGKVRYAGYSGDNETAAYAATLDEIAVVQTSISIADQINIDMVLPHAFRNEVGVMAKRPIANAAWKDSKHQPGLYANYASVYHDRLKQMKFRPADVGIDGPDEKAWPELSLRFTLSQPGVNVAIIGTTNPENAMSNIAAVEHGPLAPAALHKIRAAFLQAQSKSGTAWAGQQ